jgi:hypothetical protein
MNISQEELFDELPSYESMVEFLELVKKKGISQRFQCQMSNILQVLELAAKLAYGVDTYVDEDGEIIEQLNQIMR